VVISGQFLRRAERLETRLTLGLARAGDLLELAAALGDSHHTYTLTAQTPDRCFCCLLGSESGVSGLSAAADAAAGGTGREVSRAYEPAA